MSRACARDRARPQPPRQLRRSARRLARSCCFPHASGRASCPWLVSYAVGALLGVALLALLPEALTLLAPPAVFGTLLAGILLFFTLEKLVLLRHCHTDECEVHGATAPLLFIGDAFHNFIDGAIICTAVHDVGAARHQHRDRRRRARDPQEVGDVAILLASGYSRGRALLLNVVSGGVRHRRRARRLRRGAGDPEHPALRPRDVGGQPALHRDVGPDSRPAPRRRSIANAARQVLLIAAGIGTIVLFERLIG